MPKNEKNVEPVLPASVGTRLVELYKAYRAAEAAWKEASKAACFGQDHGTLLADNGVGRAMVVIGETITYDAAKAAEILSPAKLRTVTVRKIDPALLRSALDGGKITQAQYDEIAKAKPNAAYPRMTVR